MSVMTHEGNVLVIEDEEDGNLVADSQGCCCCEYIVCDVACCDKCQGEYIRGHPFDEESSWDKCPGDECCKKGHKTKDEGCKLTSAHCCQGERWPNGQCKGDTKQLSIEDSEGGAAFDPKDCDTVGSKASPCAEKIIQPLP